MATISSSETFAKRRTIFLSVGKTVNIQGYSKLQGANQNARKLLSTDLVNTKNGYSIKNSLCLAVIFNLTMTRLYNILFQKLFLK